MSMLPFTLRRPDAAVTELDLKGFSESGGGGAALTVPGRTDTVYSVSPGLEIGGDLRFDKAVLWRPFVRAGVSWQDTDHFLLDAGFLDAPQGVSSFTISTKVSEVIADVSTGVRGPLLRKIPAPAHAFTLQPQ